MIKIMIKIISLNPNNAAYKTSQDNRANQLNPNNEEYEGESEG
jgi:hypothetical protein